MWTRRGFVGAILAAPMAFAAKRKPQLWSGHGVAKATARSVVIGGKHVVLRNRARPRETVMLSTANDNQTFMLWIDLPKQDERAFQYLELDGQWWASNSTGFDSTGTKTTFALDRAAARRIAAAYGIPLHERSKLDGGLRYTWRFPPTASISVPAAIPVVLRVENAGTTTVGITIGGRQRGPRDNRFSFQVARNGKPLPIKVAPDFGGVMGFKELAPRQHVDITCADVRAWAAFDLPGNYAIDARYEGVLVKDGKAPNTAIEQANVWDVVATGQGTIVVR